MEYEDGPLLLLITALRAAFRRRVRPASARVRRAGNVLARSVGEDVFQYFVLRVNVERPRNVPAFVFVREAVEARDIRAGK